ncbi:DUF2269 family protein [Aquincola tertiaricarbonis]|uniref:DUF2269 family protein n=1 Tax=Aquincola tertiaricarbonis TaxID=391953 RepID=UPI000614AA9D|nr:DUF2269 domain-containing protein [Aquincola tertiaricarbonis]
MSYLLLKWLHVLSSTILFGTGIGSAYYMLLASLTRDPRVAATVVGHVVVADAIFTTTTIIVQPATGLAMAHIAQLPLTTTWIFWSFVLYFVAGACWLPVVWIQLRMRDMARHAVATGTELPERYWRFLRWWVLLGIPAFVGLVIVFWLMVAKPQ